MPRSIQQELSRRERQIMDLLFELGDAPAEEVRRRLPEPPSSSAVRQMLARLEKNGFLRPPEEGQRFLYAPAVSKSAERRSALSRLVRTFFVVSTAHALTALLVVAEDL